MSERFSKKQLAASLARKIRFARQKYGFTEDSGWAQVRNSSLEVNRAYGKYVAYFDLMEEFDLDYPEPKNENEAF